MSGVSTLSNGDYNPIEMLFSTDDLDPYPETTEANFKNAYNISVSSNNLYASSENGSEQTYPTIIPGALQNWLSIDAGDTVKLSISYDNLITNRVMVRGIVN